MNPLEVMTGKTLSFGAGEELPSHTGPELFLVTLEGRGLFRTPTGETELTPETMVHCPAGVSHAVKALEPLKIILFRKRDS